MGRPPGSLNKAKLTVVGGKPAEGSAPGHGHNSGDLSDEQLQALHLRNHVPAYERALKAKKDADAAFKQVCKVIKADGGSVEDVKATIHLRTPEGEKELKAIVESRLRILRWAGVPVGVQGEMFGEDMRSQLERGYDAGKIAGMAGEECKPTYAPGTDGHQGWMDGWHHGQSAILNIKPMAKPVAASEAPPPPESELLRTDDNQPIPPDEFDEQSGD